MCSHADEAIDRAYDWARRLPAHQYVEHDDVNVLCMGAWIVGIRGAEEVLRAFLNAEFSTDPEFRRRVHKLAVLEQEKVR